MTKRTKALSISKKVKDEVFERDKWCIICGSPGLPNSHYIKRSHGGLGISENIVTMCIECHYNFDHTPKRKEMLPIVKAYLDKLYPDFSDEQRVYKKGQD